MSNPVSELAPDLQKLLQAAVSAAPNAYCPYSKWPIGAALLCSDNSIITAVNVENRVVEQHKFGDTKYTLNTICAERAVISAALAEGKRDFQAMAICHTAQNGLGTPCDHCWCFIKEYKIPNVYTVTADLEAYEKVEYMSAFEIQRMINRQLRLWVHEKKRKMALAEKRNEQMKEIQQRINLLQERE